MKPHRIRMTHNLLLNYGLYRKMEIFVSITWKSISAVIIENDLIKYLIIFQRPHKATADEMTKFHSDDYIRFLRSIRPDNMTDYNKQMQRCAL